MNNKAIAIKSQYKLDWRISLLERLLNLFKPIEQMSLEELRLVSERPVPSIIQSIFAGKKFDLTQVIQRNIPGRHGQIPIRLYYPSAKTSLPLILFFHGGGWVYGNFQIYEQMCRRIAHNIGAIVLAVGYRLAPFAKYPIALEDCYDAFLWASENAASIKANPKQIIIMGDSAGGNLATAVCLMAKEQGNKSIASQILLYPVTSGKLDQPSMEQHAAAPLLTKSRMECFVNYYARDEADFSQPYFSPLLAEDLSHLPPALIITCEYDPLHDQAQMYAQRLQEAGTSVELVDYKGMIHGFMSFPIFCREAIPAFEKVTSYVNAVISI